jgi:hypothetical protein
MSREKRSPRASRANTTAKTKRPKQRRRRDQLNAPKKVSASVRREAMKLVRDPKFLYRVGKKIEEKGVVNEEYNRLIIFLACISRVSLIVKGPSSSGKSELCRTCIQLIPPERVIPRASLSRKALAYGDGRLDGKILYLFERLGGKEADLLLRLLQSEKEIFHEYTTGQGFARRTVTAVRSGELTVITTTTQPRIFRDDETRALSLSIDTSPQQSLAIIKSKLRPRSEESGPPTEVFQEAVRILTRDQVSFTYPPWFDYVAGKLPVNEVRVRRDWGRFLYFCECIAMCRRFARGQEKEQSVEIDFADFCVAYRLLNKAFTATIEDVPEQEIEIGKAVREFYKKSSRPVDVSSIAATLGWNGSKVYKHVKSAIQSGVVAYQAGTHPHNAKRLVPTDRMTCDFLPSPKKVFDANRDIGLKVRYVHPITGKTRMLKRRKA